MEEEFLKALREFFDAHGVVVQYYDNYDFEEQYTSTTVSLQGPDWVGDITSERIRAALAQGD